MAWPRVCKLALTILFPQPIARLIGLQVAAPGSNTRCFDGVALDLQACPHSPQGQQRQRQQLVNSPHSGQARRQQWQQAQKPKPDQTRLQLLAQRLRGAVATVAMLVGAIAVLVLLAVGIARLMGWSTSARAKGQKQL